MYLCVELSSPQFQEGHGSSVQRRAVKLVESVNTSMMRAAEGSGGAQPGQGGSRCCWSPHPWRCDRTWHSVLWAGYKVHTGHRVDSMIWEVFSDVIDSVIIWK